MELQHQLGPVYVTLRYVSLNDYFINLNGRIFQFKLFNQQKDAWVLLTKPKDLDVLVVMPYKSTKSTSWKLNVTNAIFGEEINFNDLLDKAKRITFEITLTPQMHDSTEHHYLQINMNV